VEAAALSATTLEFGQVGSELAIEGAVEGSRLGGVALEQRAHLLGRERVATRGEGRVKALLQAGLLGSPGSGRLLDGASGVAVESILDGGGRARGGRVGTAGWYPRGVALAALLSALALCVGLGSTLFGSEVFVDTRQVGSEVAREGGRLSTGEVVAATHALGEGCTQVVLRDTGFLGGGVETRTQVAVDSVLLALREGCAA